MPRDARALMKRHFAFPPVEDLDSWKNEYTGTVLQASDPQEAVKQTVKNNVSKEGLERRNAFFQGSSKPKHIDRSGGEQEAEVIQTIDSRKDMLKNAAKYIGSSFHSSEKEFLPKVDNSEREPTASLRIVVFPIPRLIPRYVLGLKTGRESASCEKISESVITVKRSGIKIYLI